jgi:hypothetical protein
MTPGDPLDDELGAILRERAATSAADLDRMRAGIRNLPARRRRPAMALAQAAGIVVALGIAALALSRLPAGPAVSSVEPDIPTPPAPALGSPAPAGAVLQDPSRFAADPRRAICPLDGANYAFALAHVADFRAFYDGVGFPTDPDPALVVVSADRTSFGREPVASAAQFLAPGHYAVCIAVGDPATPSDWRPIAVTDADLSTLLPAFDMVGDPLAYAADPRFEACGGMIADVIGAFEMAQARDYRRHFPAMLETPELDVDDPAFVVVFRGAVPFVRGGVPGVTPSARAAGLRDVCVLLGTDLASATYYSGVDPAGITATRDGQQPATQPPSPTRPTGSPDPSDVATLDPSESVDPAAAPSWAIGLTNQLDCITPSVIHGDEYEPEGFAWPKEGATEPEEALEVFIRDHYVPWLPGTGYHPTDTNAWWVRWVYTVGGDVKAIVIGSSTLSGDDDGRWRIVAIRACATVEFDPSDGLANGDHVWTDASGQPVPSDVLEERGDCYRGSWIRLDGRMFVRDPSGSAYDPSQLLGSYDGDTMLPAAATRLPYRDRHRSLYLSPDRDAIYVSEGGSTVERWPRVRGDQYERTDCN